MIEVVGVLELRIEGTPISQTVAGLLEISDMVRGKAKRQFEKENLKINYSPHEQKSMLSFPVHQILGNSVL